MTRLLAAVTVPDLTSKAESRFPVRRVGPSGRTLRSTTSQFLPSVVEQEVEAGQQVEVTKTKGSPVARVALGPYGALAFTIRDGVFVLSKNNQVGVEQIVQSLME